MKPSWPTCIFLILLTRMKVCPPLEVAPRQRVTHVINDRHQTTDFGKENPGITDSALGNGLRCTDVKKPLGLFFDSVPRSFSKVTSLIHSESYPMSAGCGI